MPLSETQDFPRCPHTGKELRYGNPPGEGFAISEEGVVYFLGARTLEYDSDYFLKEYANQYGRTYLEDEENLRRMARKRLRRAVKHGSHGGSLYELGSAAGFFLDEARTLGYECEGVEISPYASEYARTKLGLNVHTGSGLETTPGRENYDVVAAFYVLEHIPDQKALFLRIADMLKPGGIFLFALPSTYGPLYRKHEETWRKTHPADHFADYSPASLAKILPLYGMELLESRPASFHPDRAGFIWTLPLFRTLYRFVAGKRGYGDTMEGVARKIGPYRKV